MQEVIIREGEQITISAKEYYQLLLDNKVLFVALIIASTLYLIILLLAFFRPFFRKG